MPSDALSVETNQILQGDVRDHLSDLPESSVHMIMCSPPYFGLRDYNVEGQIGLENDFNEYIDELVAVGEELKRVLRPDESWWLNLGDTFAGGGGVAGKPDNWEDLHDDENYPNEPPARNSSLPAKSKMLIPHRVAIALEDAGWVVRSDAVWVKPNPMPHPVKDRLNETKEFVFHLVPQGDYWFDLDPIREPHKSESIERDAYAYNSAGSGSMHCPREDRKKSVIMDADQALHPGGKNPGDVFDVPVRPFPEAHFAVYPPEIVEAPIKASCPPTVCKGCGTPYERESEERRLWERDPETVTRPQARRALELAAEHDLTDEHMAAARAVNIGDADAGTGNPYDRVDERTAALARETKAALGSYYREFAFSGTETVTSKWGQVCNCDSDATQPGIVFDPFAGAGTTCLVAKQLGRRFLGIELNPDYVAMAQKRCGIGVDNPSLLRDEDQQGMEVFVDGD